ncbi:NAD(P)H-binding protein [Actinoplanes utahensis]|uniref:NAD(P)-binding domain-containing protein n=1 Tax=Actinoplanes utahensis TaxID=1869 RepID=A0A0A6X602_ACTUT|nr:NAD(P)H-binding protein [Actinoplanes utahensis]KHD75542.1 hypothetical protein MB27_22225 [Actinoplanes utahensis]GIF32339.1 NmrA family protein [Actinoplanes utahensis]
MDPILVLGGTGTVGSRVASLLRDSGLDIRVAARHAEQRFDWDDPGSWAGALSGVRRMFLLLPDQTGLPDGFLAAARQAGVRRVVLHSDRGLEVMGYAHLQSAEQEVRDSGLDWTIVRPDWFHQDFETFFRPAVLAGRLNLPVPTARQGFIDAGDIAAVEVAALTDDSLIGELIEITGPRAISFAEAVGEISRATGREIAFDGTPEAYRAGMRSDGLPDEVVDMLVAGFTALESRGDTVPTGVVEKILGRPGLDFSAYATAAAARGVWDS